MGAYGLTRGAWLAVAAFASASVICGVFLPSVALIVLGAIVLGLSIWLAIETPPARETRFRMSLRAPSRSEEHGATAPRADSAAAPPPEPPSVQAPTLAAPIEPPASAEPAAVLEAALTGLTPVADAVAAHLWLRDEASGTLRQVAAVGPLQPSAQPLPLDGDDALAQACATGEPRIAALARLATGAGETTLWRHAFPVSATSADGAVGIDVRGTVAPDAALINSILASLRGSFAAALVQHVARTEIDAAQRLLESARELSRILDEEQVLERALAQAMALSDAATGSVMLLDEDTGRLTIAISRGLPDDVVRTTSLAEGEGIAGWVLATAQPLLVEDLPARAPAARRHGVRSAVSVPIADDDGVLGVLNVGSKSFPARFSRSHLNAIEVLGKQTATALRNARAVRRTRALYFDTLTALALALETKDPYSRGGTKRVVDLALALGRCFDLEPEDAEALHVAALVHDLGMVVAGESVATAARPLSTVERALIKMHPRIAAEMLAEAPALERVVPIVYHHHEWYDAGGYASGLAGERIPLGARILAVADAYVAMTSPRPYRPAATEREALRELSDKAGTQFDPDVVEALKQLLEGRGERVPPSGAADR